MVLELFVFEGFHAFNDAGDGHGAHAAVGEFIFEMLSLSKSEKMASLTTDRKAARRRQMLLKKVGKRNTTKVKEAIREMAGVWAGRTDVNVATIRKEAWTRK